MNFKFSICLSLLFCLLTIQAYGKEQLSVEILDEELTVDRYASKGDQLVLFISTGFGLPERIDDMAVEVAKLGVEFWHIDLVENLFLPKATSTFRALDGRYVAGLITKAHEITGKHVAVMTRAYATIPVLRGVRLWQGQQNSTQFGSQEAKTKDVYLNGVILISPEMYNRIPDLGLDPVFVPVASASNIPIMFLQSGSRGNRWQMSRAVTELQKGGATVFTKIFSGVTGIFYEADNTPETISLLNKLPREIVRANQLLLNMPTPLELAPLIAVPVDKASALDTSLRPFRGEPVPPPLNLFTAAGERVNYSDYSGKLTVVNFWASWCGPCVEEIPSLNRLREKMKDSPFELISVDYAESRESISAFMKEVDVDFPVLLDSDGKVSAQWNVVVFPSTFVIGPDGNIIYGVQGGIHWDAPEILDKLKALIDK
ncbi:MAG: TlpA family protein disulfide reductase [Gammaproteobacteria bacterium]|nr:TlpA family protein disulfide reductase [Gammaproteobacteria bacterium]